MNHFPFKTAPDIFELALPAQAEDVRFEPFESEWGTTDELLCYFRGTLIGQAAVNIGNPSLLGEGTKFIYLLPKLDSNKKYIWPSRQEFTDALSRLLLSSIPWYLRCECDCDQRPVQVIDGDVPLAIVELGKALKYSAREEHECPSFVAYHRNG